MARITSSSLTLNFTAAATGQPPLTAQIELRITAYYKKCYTYIYGLGTYSADESTDTKEIIDSDEFRQELADLVSHKIQKWREAGEDPSGNVIPMPKFDLYYTATEEDERKQFVEFLENAMKVNDHVDYMDNCRLWGSDYSDQSGVYH